MTQPLIFWVALSVMLFAAGCVLIYQAFVEKWTER